MIKKHFTGMLKWTFIILLFLFTSCSSILYVAPQKRDCTGVGAQKCYLVRQSTEGNWILHYEEIKGLEYEPGFSYKIKVKKEAIKNPAADRSSFQYLVVEVLEKKDVTDDLILEDLVDKEWKLEYMKLDDVQYGVEDKVPTLLFDQDGKVKGFAGCNNYFGAYTLDQRSIGFSDLGSTRMHCEESMELEQAFLKMLSMNLRGLFINNKLVITSEGGNQMILGYQ